MNSILFLLNFLFQNYHHLDNLENYKSLSYLIKRFPISYGYSGTLLFEETKLHPGKTAAFFIPDYSNAKYNYDQKQFHESKRHTGRS